MTARKDGQSKSKQVVTKMRRFQNIAFDDAAHRLAYYGMDDVRWRNCVDYGAPDDTYEWYYAEERLYILRHKKMKTCFFVKASSPADAFDRFRKTYLS